MKLSAIFTVAIALVTSNAFAQTPLADSVKIGKTEKGVITVDFETIVPTRSKKTDQGIKSGGEIIETTSVIIRIGFRQDWTFFRYNIPEFIVLHRERLFLFYTGAELFFEANKGSVNELYKKLRKNIFEISGEVIGPIVWIKINNGDISIIKKM